MVSPKEEVRYSGDRDRYYEERGGHYYREVRDERDMGVSSNGAAARHSQEPPDPDRGNKSPSFPD